MRQRLLFVLFFRCFAFMRRNLFLQRFLTLHSSFFLLFFRWQHGRRYSAKIFFLCCFLDASRFCAALCGASIYACGFSAAGEAPVFRERYFFMLFFRCFALDAANAARRLVTLPNSMPVFRRHHGRRYCANVFVCRCFLDALRVDASKLRQRSPKCDAAQAKKGGALL